MTSPNKDARLDHTFITAGELANQLTNTVILDCRFSLADPHEGERLYQLDHIPGALYCHLEKHLSAEKQQHGGRHPLPDAEVFARQLQSWGINAGTPVVVYDDQRFAFAARAWWLLKAAGISNVKFLDGGYQAWKAQHHPLETEPKNVPVGNTSETHLFEVNNTVNFEMILQSLNQSAYQLIDSREAPRYRGESEPIDPVAGHIPGAINKPWAEITDEAGFIRPQAFHDLRWQGFNDDKPLVIYCGSGVTACVNIVSAQLAGKQPLLYPGSWSDWCSFPQAPISTNS